MIFYDWNFHSKPLVFRLGWPDPDWYSYVVLPGAWGQAERKQRVPRRG